MHLLFGAEKSPFRVDSLSLLPTPTYRAGTAAAAPLFLYSTNTHLKYRIAQMYLGGRHFVWCSPVFSGEKLGRYVIGAHQPPSSDPASIYRALAKAVENSDGADAKINSQRATLSALAVDWHTKGAISLEKRDEILAIVKNATFADWKPLIYVIPYALVSSRTQLVPYPKRASIEPEYIIEDLADGEFDIIELSK